MQLFISHLVGLDEQLGPHSEMIGFMFYLQAFELETYTYYEINKEFCNLLSSYNDFFGLKFSVFDFVLDKNNNLKFLESNPNGQWLWLDKYSDLNISKYLAEVLTS
ncbi:hypothetical protein CEK71_22025 [Methylovulum psychrotolerans]|uniref:Uncharacterized protein n=1 Tax=Methylovulum psychrotolerans TaxID=1704499 RepID=A0A1Z4C4N5_9GAMM|nr:hypothetical protein [Methylovulum psychrotolerans]ASF48516.1 hypothetical protein CEK71_22025 [Methylovulum psychrotolerans]